jgi:cell division protein FtsL
MDMAATTATMKYASRTAVSGSNAYDLSRFKDYMPEDFGNRKAQSTRSVSAAAGSRVNGASSPNMARPAQAQPHKTAPRASAGMPARTSASPARTPASTAEPRRSAQVRQAEVQDGRPAHRTARKTRKAYGLSLFAVAGFALVAVMMVFMLLAHVKYSEITTETAALQEKLDTLTEEERKLKIAYEDAFDVNRVEEYATNVLGMTKPLDTQVATVVTTATDKAVVVDEPAPEDGGGLDIGSFLMSLVAYFK